ncbi:RNA polymerase sigma factor [Chryseobacterium echinoideorum]|uniref:RNA polymerase sigma factor n=1 Tax=Chryseobacterium echinoideorum TaxID=1549648 RepID=UPI00118541CF|nr:RNA polymerase sigma factor [Chryseobacterium echinoideorum]
MQKLNWQKIYLSYSPKLLGICRRYVADLQAAEDIVQDSFMTAIEKNQQLKDEKAVFGWLRKIVINNALQYIRKTSAENFAATEISEIAEITDTNPAMDEKKHILIYDFTREELLKSIDSLPSHHKSVFNLYFIENYTHSEIAKLLQIPVNTSKSHLLRAKKSVQDYLMKNFGNRENTKNKTAQILVFLGLGGLLWAQTFQNKFLDFKIQPQKQSEFTGSISLQNYWGFNQYFKKNLVIAATCLIMITGSVFLFRPIPSHSSIKTITGTSENNIKQNKTDNILPEKKIKTVPINADLKEIPEIPVPKSKITKSRLAQDDSEKNKKIIPHLKEENTAPVIIVKKIVQRDTIFVER